MREPYDIGYAAGYKAGLKAGVWVSMSDGGPDYNGCYLVVVDDNGCRQVEMGEWQHDRWVWEPLDGLSHVTHWMDLPALPPREG